ncbi:MAG: 50S ribosomal protein L25 [Deltaproteobacteria bacterium]|jgi:large subunit ribosomal protein L25|nr:50S ribosomal protein L25 [Deltaproteobacteria bacterium]
MGLSTILNAKPRQATNSNAARRLRREGRLPVIFYGEGMPPQSLSVDYNEFKKAFLTDPGNRSLFTLEIQDGETSPILLKEYQVDPLTRKMLHVDFLRVNPQEKISVKVPVVLVGRATGVERGGQIQQVEREIMVNGLPNDIPAVIEADVSALNLGQTMHISQVKLPDTLALVKTIDLPLAAVSVPKGARAELAAEAGTIASGGKGPTAPPAKAGGGKAAKKK